MSVPAWLRKPKHKKEVIATDNGWVVKDTGEVLVRVNNLKKKLNEYLGVTEAVEVSKVHDPVVPEPVIEKVEPVVSETEQEPAKETEVVIEPVSENKEPEVDQPQPKKRGRKPKSETQTQ